MNFFSDWIDTLFPFVMVAFVSVATWFIQELRIDRIEAEHAAYVAQAEAHAAETELAKLAKETYWKEEVANAQLEAEKRIAAVQADLRTAHAAAVRLRGDVSALQSRLASASREAVLESAAALGELFDECTGEYLAMADKAQRHAGDVCTLSEAWPK
jgi:chromosome condensin MukBEF ATPase and DNA-binding subunit MukB